MVFSPYRLFCFLLLKQAGISTVQASFVYNETAATRKVSIHDFLLANTMHDFLYSICGTKCERFSSVQAYPESCYISCKTKAAGLPPIPLDVYFLPTQTARLPQGVFSTRICASNRSASADNSNLANLSGKLLHPRKAKRYSFHPYRLTFIFSQRRRHGYHMAFSLPESVRRIISPASSLSGKLLHLTQNKSGRASTIPLNVYFFPTQTARLPQGVFSTRICASNYFASVKPIRKAATSTKSKAVQFSPIPLDVYLFPTQTARLPQGVFSTRICASNRSANADTWEIIPTMQS